ncbi:UNVERIFIED_CONTAM: hypothetical protein RMT77_001136 [Armadillidium vulgare]
MKNWFALKMIFLLLVSSAFARIQDLSPRQPHLPCSCRSIEQNWNICARDYETMTTFEIWDCVLEYCAMFINK